MRIITSSLIVATAFLGLSVSRAHAQTLVVANIPFAFVVRNQHFPAGRYEVRRAGESRDLVAIQGEYNRTMGMSFTQPASGGDPAGNQPVLVFNHSGNDYRLSEIWQSGTDGLALLSFGHASESSRADAGTGTDASGELAYVVAETFK